MQLSQPLLLVSLLLLFAAQRWLTAHQPAPYMDELFHIPQAQAFCIAFRHFRLPSYDPSLTTPPALYLPFALLHNLSRGFIPCNPFALRLYSAVAALLTLPLLSSLITVLPARVFVLLSDNHSYSPNGRQVSLTTLLALVLWLHPVALFYAHLYYTDTQALFLILFAWYSALRNRHKTSAFAALFAASTRQTAVPWHFYIAAHSFLHFVLQSLQKHPSLGVTRLISQAMRTLWPHAMCGCLYAVFFFLNGGIALGDKGNHVPTLHWAMLPYFLGFHAVSILPLQLCAPTQLIQQLRMLTQKRVLLVGALAIVCMAALVCATGDFAHPFVLADNRHYTFYVYRRWLLRSIWRRLLLLPVYVWGVLGPFLELRLLERELVLRERDGAGVGIVAEGLREVFVEHVLDALMVMCAAVCVVPSALLEPRYFTVGSILFSLRRVKRQTGRFSVVGLIGMVAMLMALNFVLLYVFVELPFEREVDAHMPHDLSPGRFMF